MSPLRLDNVEEDVVFGARPRLFGDAQARVVLLIIIPLIIVICLGKSVNIGVQRLVIGARLLSQLLVRKQRCITLEALARGRRDIEHRHVNTASGAALPERALHWLMVTLLICLTEFKRGSTHSGDHYFFKLIFYVPVAKTAPRDNIDTRYRYRPLILAAGAPSIDDFLVCDLPHDHPEFLSLVGGATALRGQPSMKKQTRKTLNLIIHTR